MNDNERPAAEHLRSISMLRRATALDDGGIAALYQQPEHGGF